MNQPNLEQIRKIFWNSKVKMHKNNDYQSQQLGVACNNVTALSKKKNEYYTNMIMKNSGNLQTTWGIINSVLKPSASYMPNIKVLGILINTLVLMFNTYFCTFSSRLVVTAYRKVQFLDQYFSHCILTTYLAWLKTFPYL